MEPVTASSSEASPGVHVPPPLFFVGAYAAGIALARWRPWPIFSEASRDAQLVAGWGLTAVATTAALWALGAFVRARTPVMPNRSAVKLVRSGVYRWTRNPMYVALSLQYAGVAVLMNAAWPLVLLPVPLLVLQLFIVPREERHLAARFGADYENFRSEVRRWL